MMEEQQSILLKANGSRIEVEPKNGKHFTLEEVYKLIDTDQVELIATKNKGLVMLVDEDGKMKKKPYNVKATSMANVRGMDYVVGDVVICPKKLFK